MNTGTKVFLFMFFVIVVAVVSVIIWQQTTKKKPPTPDPTPTYEWETAEKPDAPCTETCGGGKRYRDVWCATKDGKRVDDSFCTQDKPPNQEDCNTQPCGWTYSDWGPDCPDCGVNKKQTRTATCGGKSCDDSAKEALERPCNIKPCNWSSLEWGECDKPCNGGSQKRTPVCSQGADQCGDMPSTTQSCNTDPCNWDHGDWTADNLNKTWTAESTPEGTITISGTPSNLSISGTLDYTTVPRRFGEKPSTIKIDWNVPQTNKNDFTATKPYDVIANAPGPIRSLGGPFKIRYEGLVQGKLRIRWIYKDNSTVLTSYS